LPHATVTCGLVNTMAIRNLRSGQTQSWSLHKSAELRGQLDSMKGTLDPLEKDMLKGYFSFLQKYQDHEFLHWNMRDDVYGFHALEHRYRVLGGKPFELPDEKKIDLARLLVRLYGKAYAPHKDSQGRKGRIMALAELNKVTDEDALTGAQEAEAFEQGNYILMHRSTLRKLDMFANFFERTHEKSLITNAKWMDKVGVHPVVITELVKDHPLFTIFVVGGALAGALAKYNDFWRWLTH
ncbi:hypothetical protein, partial [Pseudomonas aeruginosa]|uniref:hypothetical protein n=1 Tax=Pseudomonas aeruginosa TaxID=287 RepID=UPI0039696D3A